MDFMNAVKFILQSLYLEVHKEGDNMGSYNH